MKKLLRRLGVATLTFVLGVALVPLRKSTLSTSHTAKWSSAIKLSIQQPSGRASVYKDMELNLTVTNGDSRPVSLVEPFNYRQVPGLRWTILNAETGALVAEERGFTCADNAGLSKDAIFELAPGESKVLSQYLTLPIDRAGTYRIVLTYETDPAADLGGGWGGPDPVAVERVRHSTRAVATSNEIKITLHDDRPTFKSDGLQLVYEPDADN